MSDPIPDNTIDSFTVEDGIDAELDLHIKVLSPANFPNTKLVYLNFPNVYRGETGTAITMTLELLHRVTAELDTRYPTEPGETR